MAACTVYMIALENSVTQYTQIYIPASIADLQSNVMG